MAENSSIDPRALDTAYVEGLYEDLRVRTEALQAEAAKQERARNGKSIRERESRTLLIRVRYNKNWRITPFSFAYSGKLKPLRSSVSSAKKAIRNIGLDREYF